jgi:uncharacterized membrane protein
MGTRMPTHADHHEAAPEGSASVGFPSTRPNGDRAAAGRGGGDRFANALGWLSVGLGVAELIAPRRVARLIGVDDGGRSPTVMRVLGLREISSGIGILAQRRPRGWVWSRVAGDAIDLALLGSAMTSDRTRRSRTAAAAGAVLGIATLDVLCATRTKGREKQEGNGSAARGIRIRRSITINRPPEDVYRFWHDFENLPCFMQHLEAVEVTDGRRSHWKARGPAGMTVEWDAEMTEDRPNELIAWRSVEGSRVQNAGSVHFRPAPGGRGTEVVVDLAYDPPGGAVGATLAKLFRTEPGQQVQDDLRRLKQVMETGEVVLSDASAHRGPHPARPSRQPSRPAWRRPTPEPSVEAAR